MYIPTEDLKRFAAVAFALLRWTSVRALFLVHVHFHFNPLENQEAVDLRLAQRSDTECSSTTVLGI